MKEDLAKRIKETAKLTGNFLLRSGNVADTYFDKYGGIPLDERNLYSLFNDKEFIQFENGQEDFISWVLERGGISQ